MAYVIDVNYIALETCEVAGADAPHFLWISLKRHTNGLNNQRTWIQQIAWKHAQFLLTIYQHMLCVCAKTNLHIITIWRNFLRNWENMSTWKWNWVRKTNTLAISVWYNACCRRIILLWRQRDSSLCLVPHRAKSYVRTVEERK